MGGLFRSYAASDSVSRHSPVFDSRISKTDAVLASMLKDLLQKQRFQRWVELLSHVFEEHRLPELYRLRLVWEAR